MNTSLDEKIQSMINSAVSNMYNSPMYRQRFVYEEASSGESLLWLKYGVRFKDSKATLLFRSESNKEQYIEYSQTYSSITLDKEIGNIFDRIIHAINNSNDLDKDRSYSKSLVVPLFKYANESSRLVIKNLITNTIRLLVTISCYDWSWYEPDKYDDPEDLQNTQSDRYHGEIFELDVPINDINNKEKIKDMIYDYIYKYPIGPCELDEECHTIYFMDIDNIDIDIIGFTVDVSGLTKNQIYSISNSDTQVGLHKSYRTDQEVISDTNLYDSELLSMQDTVFARIAVLLTLTKNNNIIEGFIEYYNSIRDKNVSKHISKTIDILIEYIRSNSNIIIEDWVKIFSRLDRDGVSKVYPLYYLGYEGVGNIQRIKEIITYLINNTHLLDDKYLTLRAIELLEIIT